MDDEEEKSGALGQSVENAKQAKEKVDEQAKKAKKTVKVIKFLIKHPYLLAVLRHCNSFNHYNVSSSLYNRW